MPTLQRLIRRRIATVVFCLTLSALVLYWASLDLDEKPRHTRRRALRRSEWSAGAEAYVCEMIAPYGPRPLAAPHVRFVMPRIGRTPRVARSRSSIRFARLVPFEPMLSPYNRN